MTNLNRFESHLLRMVALASALVAVSAAGSAPLSGGQDGDLARRAALHLRNWARSGSPSVSFRFRRPKAGKGIAMVSVERLPRGLRLSYGGEGATRRQKYGGAPSSQSFFDDGKQGQWKLWTLSSATLKTAEGLVADVAKGYRAATIEIEEKER